MASIWNAQRLGHPFEDSIIARLQEEKDLTVQDALFWVAHSFLDSPTFVSKLLLFQGESQKQAGQELAEQLLDHISPELLAGSIW